jgi:exosortase
VGLQHRAWPAVALVLAAIAFAPLWLASGVVTSRYGFEQALFRPAPMPALPLFAIALWLAWRRLARLAVLPARTAPALAAACFAIAVAALAWSALAQSPPLRFASAAALALAFGAGARASAGVRALALPASVLLLGVALPAPLERELVWQLQQGSAAGAEALLRASGHEALRAGIVLTTAGHAFQVIDGCSGLRGILILALVALVVRELFARAGARAWLVVAFAPLLGHALNLVRIAWIATSGSPARLAGQTGDHAPQGVALLAVGTAILYGLGWTIARTRALRAPAPAPPSPAALPWRTLALALAVLAAIALGVRPFALPAASPPTLAFPLAGAGWSGEPIASDPDFTGTLAPGASLERRYAKTGRDGRTRTVELLIAAEPAPPLRSDALFSRQLAWPAPRAELDARRTTALAPLGRDAELAEASLRPGPERALVYAWRVRDAGLARESLRALLALESTPWRRERARVAVRLVAAMPQGGPVAYDIARRALDAFVADFRNELGAL